MSIVYVQRIRAKNTTQLGMLICISISMKLMCFPKHLATFYLLICCLSFINSMNTLFNHFSMSGTQIQVLFNNKKISVVSLTSKLQTCLLIQVSRLHLPIFQHFQMQMKSESKCTASTK